MTYNQEYGTGAISASEKYILRWDPFQTERRRLVLFAHGHDGDATTNVLNNLDLVLKAVSEIGLPFLSIDAGGPRTWGTDVAHTRVATAVTYAENRGIAKTDGVVLVGASMGTLTVANYAARNPSKVKAQAWIYPLTDLAYPYANAFGAEIDTAWGSSAAYLAAKATHDPLGQVSSFAGMPIKGWFSTTDTVIGPDTWPAFVTAMGGLSTTLEQSSLGPVAHGGSSDVPAAEVAAYVARFT